MTNQPNNSVDQKAEHIVLQSLEAGPKSIEDITSTLLDSGYGATSNRIAKEVAWKLVDEGEANFNNNWLLEAQIVDRKDEDK